MYNEKRVKLIRKGAVVLFVLIGLLAGFGLGQLTESKANDAEKQKASTSVKKTVEEKTKDDTLKSKDVEAFLIAYYTKKDLSENRTRYKPFMTSTMYTQETDIENLPVNQAYKGYVINQVFDRANIYIDTDNNIALAEVEYHNTQLMEKGTTDGALIDTPEKVTLKITYAKQGNRFKVDKIEKILLTSTGITSRDNKYDEFKPDEETETSTEGSGAVEDVPVSSSEATGSGESIPEVSAGENASSEGTTASTGDSSQEGALISIK